jgi:hypothetical protein
MLYNVYKAVRFFFWGYSDTTCDKVSILKRIMTYVWWWWNGSNIISECRQQYLHFVVIVFGGGGTRSSGDISNVTIIFTMHKVLLYILSI